MKIIPSESDYLKPLWIAAIENLSWSALCLLVIV